MTKKLMFFDITLLWLICHTSAQRQLPSLFKDPAPTTINSKICINVGSKHETIGPYQPSSSISFPVGAVQTQEIVRIKPKFDYRRAFQLVVRHPTYLFFSIQADIGYRYNLELGFIDVGKYCKNGGTSTDVSIGGGETKRGLTSTRSKGCSKPYYVTFKGVESDDWVNLMLQQ